MTARHGGPSSIASVLVSHYAAVLGVGDAGACMVVVVVLLEREQER